MQYSCTVCNACFCTVCGSVVKVIGFTSATLFSPSLDLSRTVGPMAVSLYDFTLNLLMCHCSECSDVNMAIWVCLCPVSCNKGRFILDQSVSYILTKGFA